MIEVCGLTKQYGKKVVVNDVTFTVSKGEIVGFLGPNGAGKSTTLNMITGYTSSTCGTVKINGYDILEQSSKAKAGIGYLPEIPPLYDDMTVKDYLNFVYDLKGCSRKENIRNRNEHLKEVCNVVRIENVYNRIIKHLSKGYKQRVGIAQALIGNPGILIFDEPTVGLDPREIVEIRNLIKRLGAERTVILSSHILSEIQAVCERVIVINEGYVVLDAAVSDLPGVSGANTRYGVRLAVPDDADVEGAFMSIRGITSVTYSGSSEKGTKDFIVSASAGGDIRKSLFDVCARKGWYILMITPLGMSLEDVFLSLVDKKNKDINVKAIGENVMGEDSEHKNAEDEDTKHENAEDAEMKHENAEASDVKSAKIENEYGKNEKAQDDNINVEGDTE